MKVISKGIRRLWKNDAVNYERVTYYPRKPDHKDPPFEPTKLLMVEKVKSCKGQPYWDKNLIKKLNLDHDSGEKIAIVKNIPEVCSMLWRIKHLIKITPIKLPKELPEDLLTSRDTYLHENGTLMVFPKVSQERLDASEKFEKNPKKLDRETLKKYLRYKWLNPMESNGSVK